MHFTWICQQERDAVHVRSKQHHHHTKRSHGDLPPSHSRDNIHDEAGTTGSNSQHDGTVFSRAEESEPRTSKGLDYAQMKLMVEVLGRLIASAPQVWLPLVWETVHNPEAQRFAKALVQETLGTLGKRTAEEWILQISEVLHHADNAREYLKSRWWCGQVPQHVQAVYPRTKPWFTHAALQLYMGCSVNRPLSSLDCGLYKWWSTVIKCLRSELNRAHGIDRQQCCNMVRFHRVSGYSSPDRV